MKFSQRCKMLLYIFICFTLLGCKTMQSSSGFQLDKDTSILPPGVPGRVGVALFVGESPINQQATDQFSAGLLELGFDVIERGNFQAIIDEIRISNADLFSDSTRVILGEQLALEAIFIGSITSESTFAWVNTHINVKLVDIATGRVIWAVSTEDPRPRIVRRKIRANVETSVSYTVMQALELLKCDLCKISE